MFNWLQNKKIKKEVEEDKKYPVFSNSRFYRFNSSNYTIENNNVKFMLENICFRKEKYEVELPLNEITHLMSDKIVRETKFKTYNKVGGWYLDGIHLDVNLPCYSDALKDKTSFITYEKIETTIYEYDTHINAWKIKSELITDEKILKEESLLEVFKNHLDSKYKLIETEDELEDYLSSGLDCDTWCRKKLYEKMKELGLGEGFISLFADLINNDLDRYHAMIELANEVNDKDLLMYLFIYKFGNKEE